MKKTNALRMLDSHSIDYDVVEYDPSVEVDGAKIAKENGLPVEQVFKTLVAEGKDRAHFVFVIPVEEELDLKKAAHVAGEKKMEMVHVKDLLNLTGYIRGGCSPLGAKKNYPVYMDASSNSWDDIAVSAGVRGMQIVAAPADLQQATRAVVASLTF